jgi:prophage regulatory protein
MTILRYRELAAAGIPWSRTHITALEAAGQFPKRVHIGPRTVGWLSDEIEQFKHRAAAKRG